MQGFVRASTGHAVGQVVGAVGFQGAAGRRRVPARAVRGLHGRPGCAAAYLPGAPRRLACSVAACLGF